MAKKKTPTVLAIAKGKKLDPEEIRNEPNPEGDLLEAPEWFNDQQTEIWNAAIQSAPKGLLRILDKSILTIWVVASAAHKYAVQELEEEGLVILTPQGYPVQSPYLQIVNKQAEIMIKAGSEMGFTPSSRTKVKVSKAIGSGNKFSSNGRRQA